MRYKIQHTASEWQRRCWELPELLTALRPAHEVSNQLTSMSTASQIICVHPSVSITLPRACLTFASREKQHISLPWRQVIEKQTASTDWFAPNPYFDCCNQSFMWAVSSYLFPRHPGQSYKLSWAVNCSSSSFHQVARIKTNQCHLKFQ